MNWGTEKNQAVKTWPKKYRDGPEYSKVAHAQTSHFQKEFEKTWDFSNSNFEERYNLKARLPIIFFRR